jgi:simple sugar transport system permease protein
VKSSAERLRAPALTAAVLLGGLAAAAVALLAAGKNPVEAARVLFEYALLSRYGLYEVLARTVPLTLTGLGIAVAFRANVYNIGGDGQLIAGAIAGAAVVLTLGVSGWFALPLLLLVGTAGGALLGALAGWLRARFDANEIIVTIMLNYVAAQLLGWVIRGPLQESARIIPRSDALPPAARLPELIEGSQLHAGLLIALAAVAAVWVLMRHSRFGFQLMAVGENRTAAAHGGIRVGMVVIAALTVSGALCGLAGSIEVAGTFYRLEENMAPGVGITAIAVALLARLNPLAVPFTALLFGVLVAGAGALQRQMNVPFQLIWVIEALVIMAFLIVATGRLGSWRSTAHG